MKIAARCDKGMLRKTNQDSVYYNDRGIGILPNFMIVADGMGGHQAGEQASQLAVSSMVDLAMEQKTKPEDPAAWLADCVRRTNETVFCAAESNPLWHGMGTTLVAAFCMDGTLYCANVGDSRLYVLEEKNGTTALRKVTVDHSLVEEMVLQGVLTPEEARIHPQKNLITRGIGIEPDVEVDTFTEPLAGTRLIVACSDGLTNMMDENEMLRILFLEEGNPDKLAERLKNEANSRGGHDNISVIVADVRGEESC